MLSVWRWRVLFCACPHLEELIPAQFSCVVKYHSSCSKYKKIGVTLEICLAAVMKSLQSCSKDRTQGISSGSSNLWQFLKIKIQFIFWLMSIGGSRKLVSHISISRLAFNTAHNQRAWLTQKGPHSRILLIILYLSSYHHSMLFSQGIAHHSRIWSIDKANMCYVSHSHTVLVKNTTSTDQNCFILSLLVLPCVIWTHAKLNQLWTDNRWVMTTLMSDYNDLR